MRCAGGPLWGLPNRGAKVSSGKCVYALAPAAHCVERAWFDCLGRVYLRRMILRRMRHHSAYQITGCVEDWLAEKCAGTSGYEHIFLRTILSHTATDWETKTGSLPLPIYSRGRHVYLVWWCTCSRAPGRRQRPVWGGYASQALELVQAVQAVPAQGGGAAEASGAVDARAAAPGAMLAAPGWRGVAWVLHSEARPGMQPKAGDSSL